MEAIILTGCTQGLGLALHNLLIANESNKRLIFVGRALDRLDKNHKHHYIEMDLAAFSKDSFIEKLPSLTVNKITLINNAGVVTPISNIQAMEYEKAEEAYHINVLSPSKLISILLGRAPHADFKIMNISSGAANRPIAGWGSYCANKAAFKMFLDVLALEQTRVTVHHVDPGVMDTGMQKVIRKSEADEMPDVALFQSLNENNQLISPEKKAIELITKFGLVSL